MNEASKQKRAISSHVGSRWYRAPEISLMEPKYDTANDLWSLGCVFYELINLPDLKAQSAEYYNPQANVVFPGNYCYPLTPNPKLPAGSHGDNDDQLAKMLKKIGYLDEGDLSFITKIKAKIISPTCRKSSLMIVP